MTRPELDQVIGLDEFIDENGSSGDSERSPHRAESDSGPAPPRPNSAIVLGYTVAGVLIIWFSAALNPILDIPRDVQFGILQRLPITYWIGILFLGMSVFLSIRRGSIGLFLITGGVLFAVLAGTPGLFEAYPRVWDAYSHFGEAQVIGAEGHVVTGQPEYSSNWPGAFLVMLFTYAVGGSAPLDFLNMLPFITGGLTFVVLFSFLRSLFSVRVALTGSVLGFLLSVWMQFHVSPQSIGLILALLVLGTAWQRRIPYRIANAVLFVALVMSHPTSTILVLCIFVVDAFLLQLFAVLRPTKERPWHRSDFFARSPAITYLIVWSAWLFLQATTSSQTAATAIVTRIGTILQLPEQTATLTAARTTGNLYPVPPILRLGSLGLYSMLGVFSIVLLSRVSAYRRLAVFLTASILGSMLMGFIDIFAFQGQLYDRALMMLGVLMPGIGLAGIELLRPGHRARAVVVTVLLALSLASASTVYYQEAFYFVSAQAVGTSGFINQVQPASTVLDGQFPTPVWINPVDRTGFLAIRYYALYPGRFADIPGNHSKYAVFDRTSELWYTQWWGSNIYEYYKTQRVAYSRVYSNGDAEVYFIPPQTP